jgi:23S rRNA (guanine2445-N2)-methyltransferase / 23S rRNA (guanine2069-N7)-methyltransferase
MQREFDVQRDHIELLAMAGQLLEPDGVIVFSNNFQRFRIDSAGLAKFAIEDISRATIPKDFERSPRIHSCFLVRHLAQR